MIRVVLADDQGLVRSGLRALLANSDDIQVVGEASDGLGAVAVVTRTQPDVVLMDVRMPGVDGIAATQRITADQHLSEVAIIMLTTFDGDDQIFAAIRAGASGYLLKDAEPDDLREAIRVVAAGDALLSASVTRKVMEGIVSGPAGRCRSRPVERADRAGTRGTGRGRSRAVERRNRRRDPHQPGDRSDIRKPDPDEIRRPRPGPIGCHRVRDGPCDAGPALSRCAVPPMPTLGSAYVEKRLRLSPVASS